MGRPSKQIPGIVPGAVLGAVLALAGCTREPPRPPGQTLTEGNSDVSCLYSHRLPDDPIVYPGRPGVAMQHDFFGNTTTNAYTTGDMLQKVAGTTCENAADATGYWAPSLRLPDGTVVAPLYQKTYYTNTAVPSNKRFPVQPLPQGIQLMAGDHHGTGPNPRIAFNCTGSRSQNTIPTDCKPDPTNGTQFNIGMHFPTCWDGKTLAPTMGKYDNAVYPDNAGTCPAGYQVRLPDINMNIAYKLGQITDLTNVQLSLDPLLDAQGNVVKQQWGTLYTAHGDFFMGWRPDAARFMADICLNRGMDCNKTIAYSFFEAGEDATVRATDATNYGSGPSLVVQQTSGDTAASRAYLKFGIPQGANILPPDFRPDYQLMIYGANSTDTTSQVATAYRVDTNWSETTINGTNAPACSGTSSTIKVNATPANHNFDVNKAVNEAIAEGASSIAFCIQGPASGQQITFDSREGANDAVLFMRTLNKLPY
ncbi:CBM96 family carbohydrate-binding protein [Cupriavidus agavae]|uniref:Uncharacterized protein DUF1996 n=1 Tax=Cupriavidus agavae TaxID=1001822 RepID=A0A4Q7RCM2_9BURK|nr:DUF1996 domain-containing protein [Cupriavidus agavae]RZT30881.1 uncharacterized protein DUF1996 [Cupriavidus agavae]